MVQRYAADGVVCCQFNADIGVVDRLALVGGLSADRKARSRPRFPGRFVRPVKKELKSLRLSSGFGYLIRMDNCVC